MKQNTDYNPWAGLASYEDPATAEQKLKFCGRDDDSYDVAKLIMGNIFVTLYGKSGIGKTSLLNAGVFPELREEQYTPLSLRLGMRDEKEPKSYQAIIIEAVMRTADRIEIVNVVDEQTNDQAIDYLWNFFARHIFYNCNGERISPVIVFDQFEEVFRTDCCEADTLLRQLDYINDRDHTLDNCTIDGKTYRYETNFRFVVSIREDDLYRLEDSLDNCYLPALKRCRYRLRSLSEEGARDVILIPGKGLFNPNEQETIAESIMAKSKNEDGSISTNIISLLCSRIYTDFQQSDADHITPSLVESFLKGNPFEHFYKEATTGLSHRVRRKLENNLITEDGHRKYIELNTFESYIPNKGLRDRLLDSNSKILQRVHISSQHDVDGVELIHDSFCKAILSMRQKKQDKMSRRFYVLLLLLLLFVVCETTYLMCSSSNDHHQQPINSWTIKLVEDDNVKAYKWEAEIVIKDSAKDTVYARYDSINAFNCKNSEMRYTPDSTVKEFVVHVTLHCDKDVLFPIQDTTICVSNTSESVIFRKIMERKYDYTVKVLTNVIYKKEVLLLKEPVNNATVMTNNVVGYTDTDGICRLTLRKEIQPDDTLLIFREGYLSICTQWKDIEKGKNIYIQIRDEVVETARQERLDRVRLIDSIKNNYTQILFLKRNNQTEDTIYLRAFEVQNQDLSGSQKHHNLKIVKGCYYYRSQYPQVKEKWKDVPLDKLCLLDGYVDESDTIDGHSYVYFFEGTDMANNKEQFFGTLNGDSPWKNGQYIVPGQSGLSGTYQNIILLK